MSESARSSTRGRRHTTTACRPCRDDKIKCDGATPTCNQCVSKQRDCTYSSLVDRRKLSNRKTVQVFSRRVRQLEQFIASQQLTVPVPFEGDAEALDQLVTLFAADEQPNSAQITSDQPSDPPVGAVSLPSATAHVTEPTISSPTLAPTGVSPPDASLADFGATTSTIPQDPNLAMTWSIDDAIDADWVWTMATMPQFGTELGSMPEMFEDSLFKNDTPVSSIRPENPLDFSSPFDPRDDGSVDENEDDDHSAVTNQLSARLGTLLLSGHGESHYYGSTSNYNLVQDESLGVGQRKPYPSLEQAQERLKMNNLDQPIENNLVDHLLSLYFAWHDPSLHIVDWDTFSSDRQKFEAGEADTAFFSPMLINAMCAVGANFELQRDPAYSGPLAEHFAKRAVALLYLELERPRVATVQALAILSCHEIAYARDTRAWLFSGMSVRLSLDFGLHVSTQPYVDAGKMTTGEARGRSVAFWGSFATDRMWGLYLGRPLHNFSKAVSVEKPMFFHTVQNESYWHAYGSPGSDATSRKLADKQETLIEYWIELSEIMSALEGSLYFQIEASNIELQKLAHQTFERLLAWKTSLPADVNLDLEGQMPPACLPHLIVLHMVYAYLVIVLHRPFVAKHYIQPSPLIGQGPVHARDMCVRAALQIAKLLGWYEKQHTLRRANILIVQIVFSAALVLVYATVSQSDPVSHQELFTSLEVCSSALAKLGDIFENASRALEVLLRIKRVWQARLLSAPTGSKRSRPSFLGRHRAKRRNEFR